MDGLTFDTLAYSKKLIGLGFTQEQAEGFAELAKEERQRIRAEIKADLKSRDKLEESERSKLATKSDVADVRLEVEKLRSETRSMEKRIIIWVGTVFAGLVCIMAKGFGWLGF